MIITLLTFWAVAAPMGFLAGDIFSAFYLKEGSAVGGYLPYISALFTPLGTVFAIILILDAHNHTGDEDNE